MAVIDLPAAASERLTRVHIAGAMALSVEAGWNQTPDDWALFIDRGQTRGIFIEGELIATAATLPYEPRLGYVSMVLVTPRYRNRGIATRMLRESVDDLEARDWAAMLDATPAGAVVYRRLGFVDIFPLRRWQGEGGNARGAALRPARPQDVDWLITLDATAFGASRWFLIRDFLARSGTQTLVSDAGFVVRRKGIRADQIGPLVAADAQGAQQLLAAALGLGGGPVFLDVPDHQQSIAAMLEARKFSVQRPFTRMAHGLSTRPDDPARLFVAAGPEFG
jgi:GNAT superfamily N-acetyltransferase